MDRRRLRLVLVAVSVASIIITVAGLAFGFPFMALFLFFPGLLGLGGWGRDEQTAGGDADRRYCPECGAPVDPVDGFCRYCGRRLRARRDRPPTRDPRRP